MEARDDNPYHIRNYRNAAQTIRKYDKNISRIIRDEGNSAIESLPGIGYKLSCEIREILVTGKSGLEEQLKNSTSLEKLLSEVPGIGENLAARIHDELGIPNLKELEIAAHDGRLEKVERNQIRKIAPKRFNPDHE